MGSFVYSLLLLRDERKHDWFRSELRACVTSWLLSGGAGRLILYGLCECNAAEECCFVFVFFFCFFEC